MKSCISLVYLYSSRAILKIEFTFSCHKILVHYGSVVVIIRYYLFLNHPNFTIHTLFINTMCCWFFSVCSSNAVAALLQRIQESSQCKKIVMSVSMYLTATSLVLGVHRSYTPVHFAKICAFTIATFHYNFTVPIVAWHRPFKQDHVG